MGLAARKLSAFQTSVRHAIRVPLDHHLHVSHVSNIRHLVVSRDTLVEHFTLQYFYGIVDGRVVHATFWNSQHVVAPCLIQADFYVARTRGCDGKLCQGSPSMNFAHMDLESLSFREEPLKKKLGVLHDRRLGEAGLRRAA